MERNAGKNGGRIQFVLVYICEAHASDTWPMKWSVEWPRPVDIEQRIKYAQKCVSDLSLQEFKLLIDPMSDDFNTAFKSWPTAYYVMKGKELSYIGVPEETSFKYDVKLLLKELDALL
jgi:hypothetical protein